MTLSSVHIGIFCRLNLCVSSSLMFLLQTWNVCVSAMPGLEALGSVSGPCQLPTHDLIFLYVPLCFLMRVELVGHIAKHMHSCLEIGRVGFLNLKVYKACSKSANSLFYSVVRSTFTVGVMHFCRLKKLIGISKFWKSCYLLVCFSVSLSVIKVCHTFMNILIFDQSIHIANNQ